MTLRSNLVPPFGRTDPTTQLETAHELATKLGARIHALFIRPDPRTRRCGLWLLPGLEKAVTATLCRDSRMGVLDAGSPSSPRARLLSSGVAKAVFQRTSAFFGLPVQTLTSAPWPGLHDAARGTSGCASTGATA